MEPTARRNGAPESGRGRASAPIIPQPVQIMRDPNAGTSAASGDSSW